jgi:hypothetical protein
MRAANVARKDLTPQTHKYVRSLEYCTVLEADLPSLGAKFSRPPLFPMRLPGRPLALLRVKKYVRTISCYDLRPMGTRFVRSADWSASSRFTGRFVSF